MDNSHVSGLKSLSSSLSGLSQWQEGASLCVLLQQTFSRWKELWRLSCWLQNWSWKIEKNVEYVTWDLFTRFDFTLSQLPGCRNIKDDALSLSWDLGYHSANPLSHESCGVGCCRWGHTGVGGVGDPWSPCRESSPCPTQAQLWISAVGTLFQPELTSSILQLDQPPTAAVRWPAPEGGGHSGGV